MNAKTMKTLLIVLGTLAVTRIYADNWFVRPDITATAGDGHSWEEALCVSDFQMLLANELAGPGDVFHLAGGVYTPHSNTDNFRITQGVTLIGGYAGNLQGTDTPSLVWPSENPTIFSGDKNGNDLPDTGDIANLLVINSMDTVTLQGLEFRCAYFPNESYGAGALYAGLSNIVVKNCIFRNNASNYYGGAAFTCVGSFSRLTDCIFTENTARSRGGAILIDNAAEENGGRRSVCITERCQLTGNSLAYESTDGKYGAAIQIRHGNLWVINSTIADNKAYCNGAGLSVSDGDTAYIVSSTLANNICTRIHIDLDKSNSYGSSIRMEKEAVLYIANSISVEGPDDTGDKHNPTCYTENYTKSIENYFTSGGYNYLGTFYDLSKKYEDPVWNLIWKASDQPSTPVSVHRYADVFHTNSLADNGGNTHTISPAVNAEGASLAHLQNLLIQWKCPADVAFDRDQRGYVRNTVTYMGAIDLQSGSALTPPSGHPEKLIGIGNGIYRIADAKHIKVFDISGQLIFTAQDDTVDLSALPKGMYLINTEENTYKILR